MTGEVGILNVGCGDTKLVFNRDDAAECIRAGAAGVAVHIGIEIAPNDFEARHGAGSMQSSLV